MNDLYRCGAFTIYKYTDIVCGVLSSRDRGLFTTYIHTPIGNRLHDIMERFRNSTGLPNICEAINGTHIPLMRCPSSDFTLMASNSSIRRSSIVLFCKESVTWIEYFGMFVKGSLVEFMTQAIPMSSLYYELHQRHILSDPTIVVRGIQVKPYLIGDSAYPN